MTLRPLPRALPALAVLLLALCACGKKDEPAAEAAPASLAVSVAPVQSRTLASSFSVSGPVAAVEEMQLGVELGGQRVTALNVDVGERVRAGQVLLTLDHRTLDSDLRQADAALAEAEAGVRLAESNVRRAEPLVAGKYISAAQLDELRAARTQAQARRATARAARDAAALRRSFAELRAPANGVISKRLVQAGQIVGTGTELLRLIRDGRLEWRAELTSAQLAQVSPGDRIELRTAGGARVDGVVRAVAPGVDAATRTGTVYADLPRPDGLQPGAFLEGRVLTGEAASLTVPAAAVLSRDGYATVFTVDAGNQVHRVRIEAGSREQGWVEVRGGLKAGERVVVDGAGFLADGDRVRVVAAGAAAP